MEWGDVLLIVLLAAGVWTFIPRHVRFDVRAALSPATAVLLDTLHEGARAVREVVTHIAYRGLLGVPVPPPVIVKSGVADDEREDVVLGATKQQNNNNAIATPATDNNALLFQQRATDLALAVRAKKIGETAGIKLYFGVSPSSTSPAYIAARAALKVELAKLDPPKFRRTPEMENAREALGLNKAR